MSRSNVKVKCQGQMSRSNVKVLALEAVVAHSQQYAKLLEETMNHLKKKKPRLIESGTLKIRGKQRLDSK